MEVKKERKKVKRMSWIRKKDDCRNNGTAYLEKCQHCKKKTLMCGHKDLKGGQCMPQKCREIRIIEEPMGTTGNPIGDSQ